jgi:predicted TIM-barrel fold metal-dependent hydrolase
MAADHLDVTGRMIDCDSHLYLTPEQCSAAMGPDFAQRYARVENAAFGERDVVKESEGIVVDAESVWIEKGWNARGGFDAESRLEALDLMGVDRQVIFPDGLQASLLASRAPGAADAARIYNDYIIDWARPGKGRLQPTAMLSTYQASEALAEAERTIAAGAFGFYMNCSAPPGGLAPADPAWDPLWELLAQSGTPAFLHVGSQIGFFDPAWGRIPGPPFTKELGPFNLATCHIGPQVYLTSLLLGGVFERHEHLRVGIIEMTAQWVGPLVDMLDQCVEESGRRMSKTLSIKPSEYIERNVRVTPFWWEPVGRYIDQYGLANVYVFSTDFPHTEGGEDPVGFFRQSLAGADTETFDNFFVGNGDLICPAR